MPSKGILSGQDRRLFAVREWVHRMGVPFLRSRILLALLKTESAKILFVNKTFNKITVVIMRILAVIVSFVIFGLLYKFFSLLALFHPTENMKAFMSIFGFIGGYLSLRVLKFLDHKITKNKPHKKEEARVAPEQRHSENYYKAHLQVMGPDDKEFYEMLLTKFENNKDQYYLAWKEFESLTEQTNKEMRGRVRSVWIENTAFSIVASLVSSYALLKFIETSNRQYDFDTWHYLFLAAILYYFISKKVNN